MDDKRVTQKKTYQGAEALVSLEVLAGGLAAGDGDDLVVVADADVVAIQPLLLGLGELLGGPAADATRGGLAGSGGGGGGIRAGASDGLGVGVGVCLAEHLKGDVAGEGRPAVGVEGAQAGEAGREGGVVAAAHGEPDGLLAPAALQLVLAVRGRLELDAADHAGGDVSEEGADTDGAVLL